MAQKANSPIHERDNVIPFIRREKVPIIEERDLIVTEHEVEVLLCSLCGSSSFNLISHMEGQISCGECGYLVGAKWTAPNED